MYNVRNMQYHLRQYKHRIHMKHTHQTTLQGETYTNATCKYCGKPYMKTRKHRKYCSHKCYHYARLEQKARYQRKRRKLIREKELISNENNFVGTTYLSQHRRNDFEDEYKALQKELQRISLKPKHYIHD